MFEQRKARLEHKDKDPMGSYRQATLTKIQERGYVLGLDLLETPKQDSGYSTHTLGHGTA